MWLNIIVKTPCKIGTCAVFPIMAIVYLDLFLASSLIDICSIQSLFTITISQFFYSLTLARFLSLAWSKACGSAPKELNNIWVALKLYKSVASKFAASCQEGGTISSRPPVSKSSRDFFLHSAICSYNCETPLGRPAALFRLSTRHHEKFGC
jgi:hypothetical protein